MVIIRLVSLLIRFVSIIILLVWKANPIVVMYMYVKRIRFYRKMRLNDNLARLPKML